jgi:hypothetical protein
MNKKILFLILILPFIIASKIYKWTDENEKIHFTQTPGPKQEPNKIYRDTAKKRKLKKSLQGTWFGYSPKAKFKLKFDDDSFQWFVILSKHSRNQFGKGFYSKDDSKLLFNYTSQAFNSSITRKEGGTTESFMIIDFSTSKLTLRSDNNTYYRYTKAITNQETINSSHELFGVWKNKKNNAILELKTSTFFQHAPGRYKNKYYYPDFAGTWNLKSNTVEFHYLGDNQLIDKIGLTEKFGITYSNNHLILKNTKSGKIDSYVKQIPDKRFTKKRLSF